MPQATPLPNTLGDAIWRCQAMMGAKKGATTGMFSREYWLDLINQAYEDIAQQIKNGSGKNLEAVIEVLNVPAGTTDLSGYQKYGDLTVVPPVPRGPLAGLFHPLKIWVKSAGQLPQYYTLAKGPRDTLPHINPPGITPGTYAVRITSAWIGNKLTITPVAGAIDVQVYGRFDAPRLVADTDNLVLYGNMTFVLAYGACSLAGVERTNPGILAGYAERATASMDNIVADIIRQSQREPRRIAKLGGGGGTCWGWA